MSRRKQFIHEIPCNCFIFSLVGSMVNTAGNVYNTQATNMTNQSINDRNLAFQREQFDYQKELNALQMEREDTAFQRQMEDAQKVGINPMALAGGSGAPSQALSTTSFNGSSIPSQSPQMSFDMSSLDNLPQLLLNVDQFKHQRDAIRSQLANDEVDRAVKLYENGLQYDDNGKIVPIITDKTPGYKLKSENAEQQRRRNDYYGNLPDNLPNYPALLTYFTRALNDENEYENLVNAIKKVFSISNDIGDRSNTDKGKSAETLFNLYINGNDKQKSALDKFVEARNARQLKKFKKDFNKQQKRRKNKYQQAQSNFYSNLIDKYSTQ